MTFQDALRKLINQHSEENGSDTPDFILARYICRCLVAFNIATVEREKWYGREKKAVPVQGPPPESAK